MKAIHIPSFIPDSSSLSSIQPSTIPTPTPKENSDEYLVQITHCSPQHADILHAQGKHQNNTARGWCHPPFVLGFDFAGVVVSGPPGSSTATSTASRDAEQRFKIGDRVFGAAIGAFAEFICVSGSGAGLRGSMRRIPDGLSSEDAVAMGGQAVSYASVVHVARVRSGETVLVSGASGGLGGVCCSVAKAVGARVIALTSDKGKVDAMRRVMEDVDEVFVMDGGGDGRWVDEVLRLTDGKGVDVFLDNTGMVNEGIRCLAYFGRIVILGFAARKGVMEQVKMNKLLLKSVTVVGYRFGESGRRYPDQLEEIWDGYLKMLQEGKLKPVIHKRYNGLESMGKALEELHRRQVLGKIVVKVADVDSASKL